MSRVKLTSFIAALVLAGAVLFAALPADSQAASAGACSVQQARKDVRAAKRALVRATKRHREARRVLTQTKRYSALYGPAVGRWTRLGRRTGWTGRMDWLMRHIYVESRGDHKAVNATGHSGLLQDAGFWFDGTNPAAGELFRKRGLSYPWDVFNPREHLRHNRVLDKSNWGY